MDGWTNDVAASVAEKEELLKWIDIVGFHKYKEYYELVKSNFPKSKVPFKKLRECAIYDMKISIQMFNILRIIELNFRAMVEKEVSLLTHMDWLKHINKKSKKRIKLIEDYKTRKIDSHAVLSEIDFDELRKIIESFDLLNERKNNLKRLQSFRNKIMHHKVILSNSNEETKNDIKILLSFLKDADCKDKKVKEINKLSIYDKGIVQDYKIILEEV